MGYKFSDEKNNCGIVLLLSAFCFSQMLNTLDDDQIFIESITRLVKSTKNDNIKSINAYTLGDLYRKDKNIEKFYEYLPIGNKFS